MNTGENMLGATPAGSASVNTPSGSEPFAPAYGNYASSARTAQPFVPEKTDAWFALFAFALGFLYVRWVLFGFGGLGTALFGAIFCGAAALYLLKKSVRITPAAWFYFTLAVLTGLSFALWDNYDLRPVGILFLMCLASYFVLSAAGLPIAGKTSNFLPLDGINSAFVIPFSNFACQYKSLAALKTRGEGGKKRFWPVALGLLFGVIVIAMVLPLLMEADSGGFAKVARRVADLLRFSDETLLVIVQLVLGVPVAAYLFGLIAGSAHRRKTNAFTEQGARAGVDSLRVLPAATVTTLLVLVSALYVVFIASQLPYFFSAFSGALPKGFVVYSEYARKGFFELSGIATINLLLLIAANALCKTPRKESPVLRALNAILALLTLLLIATALSKMALYIGAYGLSVRRLLPCVFMVFLAVVYGGVLAMQKWQFSIVRLSVVAGSALLCALLLSDPSGIVARYNAQRYLSGTLVEFDASVLGQAGASGVEPALRVYAATTDENVKKEITTFLLNADSESRGREGTSRDNLQNIRVRAALSSFAAQHPAQ